MHRTHPSPHNNLRPAPRLLGGVKRGFSLKTRDGKGMRPTAARARKALFDTLTHRPALRTDFTTDNDSAGDNTVWLLDAFAGSGALGLEALSRWQGYNEGRAVFFENNATTAQVLRGNVERSGLKGRVLHADALAPRPARAPDEQRESKRGEIRLAFFDPPYAMEEGVNSPRAFAEQGWFAEGALLVFQRATTQKSLSLGEGFAPLGTLSASSACFFFFRYAVSLPPPPATSPSAPQASERA